MRVPFIFLQTRPKKLNQKTKCSLFFFSFHGPSSLSAQFMYSYMAIWHMGMGDLVVEKDTHISYMGSSSK